MTVEAQIRFQDAPVQKETIGTQVNFLTWDILTNSGHQQLWDIPPKDLEVAKAALVIDGFSDLSLEQKRMFLGYRIWETTGKFAQVKEYMGEVGGPTLDSWLDQVWDDAEKHRKYQQISYEFDFLDKMDGNRSDIIWIMMLLKRIREYRTRGYSDQEILDSREQVANIRNREYSYLRYRRGGLNPGWSNEDIAGKLSVDINTINNIQRYLESLGLLKPIEPLTREAALGLRNEGVYDTEISRTFNVSRRKVNKMIRGGILSGEIKPHPKKRLNPSAIERAEEFILLRNERYNNQEISARMDIPVERVEEMARLILPSGRISPIRAEDRPVRKRNIQMTMNLLSNIDRNTSVNLREIYNAANLPFSYNAFLGAYNYLADLELVPLTRERFRAQKIKEARKIANNTFNSSEWNIAQWASELSVSYDVARSILGEIEILVSTGEYIQQKIEEFISRLRLDSTDYPHVKPSVKRIAAEIGLPYRTALRIAKSI